MKWNETIQKMNEEALKKLRMEKQRVPYCPRNGCYMQNGATPVPITTCMCGEEFKSTLSKLCPKCHTCPCCHRIGKKFSK